MGISRVKKVGVKDNDLARVQQAVSAPIDSVVDLPIIQGQLIEDVVLAAGAQNLVDHRLGRDLRGYIVVKNSTECNIWDSPTSAAARHLGLNTSAETTVSLWVF